MTPPEVNSPPKVVALQKVKAKSPPKTVSLPKAVSPLKMVSPPKVTAPREVVSPPEVLSPISVMSPEPVEPPKEIEQLKDVSEARETNGTVDSPPDEAKSSEETNGVGDKIKIFEKAAEDAATAGRASRPGSMRRRAERLPSDELPPPPPSVMSPPKIVRPEFRLASPAEVTIRSPSLGTKAPERFPSRDTAFRNVSSTAVEDDETRKNQTKDRHPGRGYFTRGSEEIWLVKKKDIEEIEERVLDSFRRARGNGGNARGKRAYARSESLEPARTEWRAQLKRQASVACTCGHDKKARAKSVDAVRPRARSHSGEEPATVLDKYETLV